MTLLLTTQYLEEADALADRVVLIDHGREVAAGTPAQLKAQVGQQRVDVIAADGAAFDQLLPLLDGRFDVNPAPEQRTISVAAPEETADLARVADVDRGFRDRRRRDRAAAPDARRRVPRTDRTPGRELEEPELNEEALV